MGDANKALASEIAKLLPSDLIVDAVGRALESALSSLTTGWGGDDIRKICRDAITEHARELLRTKYKERVAAQAELIAAQAVGEMAQYRLRDR